MNGEQTISAQETVQSGSSKMLIAMVGIGVLCALLIVLTYEGTRERISTLRANALQEAIFKVVPGVTSTKSYQLNAEGEFFAPQAADPTKPQVFAGYDASGKLKGFAIEASGQGYADVIRVLYGYDPDAQQIIGFYVLESKETPGLGDKIEKDQSFLENFTAMDVALNDTGDALENEVVTVKNGTKEHPWEIDGITGATISSRAIGNLINESAQVILPKINNQISLFQNTVDK